MICPPRSCFSPGHAPGKNRRRGSLSRGLLGGLDDLAVGVVVGEAMGAEEDSQGAIGILVNPDDGLDEVRSQPAPRQLQAEAPLFHGVVVADGAVLVDGQDLVPGGGPIGQGG
jgi:hypothetical protein